MAVALPSGRARPKGASSPSRLLLVVATVVVVHLVCYQAAAPLRLSATAIRTLNQASTLAKRTLSDTALLRGLSLDDSPPPVPKPASLIDYMGAWTNASAKAKPFLFAGFILWLVFLFAFVGITASDFFCPNLSTIASRLGLSESVAGVTFLAFSNGSPDVFSTFAALKSNSGSLAIGELIGAASFIVSVVAGTMCVIQPFRVSKHTFLRDVGFFTIAVSFTLAILYDSHIHLWEACAMVALYIIYVCVVAVGSWWIARRERRDERIRQARSEYATEASEGYRDNPAFLSPLPTPAGRSRTPSISSEANSVVYPMSPTLEHASHHQRINQALDEDTLVALAERGTPVTLTRERSRSTSHYTPAARRPKSRSAVRPSLLGAIEFRDVVNALQADSSARTLAVFGGAGEEHTHASYIGPRLDAVARGRANSHVGVERPRIENVNGGGRSVTWTAAHGPSSDEDIGRWGETDEETRLPPTERPLIDLSPGVDNPWKGVPGLTLDIPSSAASSNRTLRRAHSAGSLKVPSIQLVSEDGQNDSVLLDAPHRALRIASAVFVALFPSLHDFGDKSIVGKATAVLCVPAILALNLTLPVVDNQEEECCDSFEDKEHGPPTPSYLDDDADVDASADDRHDRETVAHRFHAGVELPWASSPLPLEDGERVLLNPPAEVEVDSHVLTRWLTAVQCTLGPVFCIASLFADDLRWWYAVLALASGLVIAAFAFWYFEDHRHPGRIVLCFVGFFVAMVWILMIVNEVVGILQTLGHIFGLSDAILGLTIFAMGNSLGDLVANATVARMGFPSMAIAACFGGPMLNILLGVGLSGTYLIVAQGGGPLHVQMGRTLIVSGGGLLAVLIGTLIIVPLNGFWMSKRMGWSLIAAYAVILSLNVVVEIWL